MMLRSKKIWRNWIPILALCAINVVFYFLHTGIDLTAEKRYTLSKGTKELLFKVKKPLKIKVFLKGPYPSGFKKLRNNSEDLLRKFRDLAGATFEYEICSPEDLFPQTEITYADTLDAIGALPLNLTSQIKQGQQQQFIYPVALIEYEGQIQLVQLYNGKSPLISNAELYEASAMLEYQFAHGISQIIQTQKPVIGYLVGNGEPIDQRVYDLSERTLRQDYDVRLINLQTQPFINPSFDAVLMVKPSAPFNEFQKLSIDQYIMRGGKIIFAVDRLDAEMDSLQILNQVIAYDRNLGITDMLFRYGVRLNPNLLMDLQCDYLPFDVNGNGQFQLLPWNYFPVMESANNHPINKNLGFVSGRFVNTIDTVGDNADVKKTILLTSSINSRSIGSPARISGSENVVAPESEQYQSSNIPTAVLLEGKFQSFFANRISNSFSDSLKKLSIPFVANSNKPGSVLVISDGDVFLNEFTKQGPLEMGMNRFTAGTEYTFPFANKSFLLNTLDYFVSRDNLMESKLREFTVRLLDSKRIEKNQLSIIAFNIIAPVLLIAVFAFIFLTLRKNKYKTKRHA